MKTLDKKNQKEQLVPEPTKPNSLINGNRAKYLAELFAARAKSYLGDIDLPNEVILPTTRDLKRARVTLSELSQLDEKPYALLPHDLASRSHWFMRRFRNSGGWRYLE